MEKHWLKSYPAEVPHEVHPEQYRSLTQLLEESFRKNAARPFSVCMERWMTYGQLDELSAALGAWLQSQGLEPGDDRSACGRDAFGDMRLALAAKDSASDPHQTREASPSPSIT